MRLNKLITLCAFLSFAFSANAQKLRIAVAANAQFVSQKLAEEFKKETNVDADLIVSSSGKLTTQIEQGAPFDVFLSADMKYPQELADKNLTLEQPRIYAYGQLIMWMLNKSLKLSQPADLQQNAVNKIAIANPSLAPYGEATLQALGKLNLTDKLKGKIVYGESIAQVNQYLLSGAAEVAFTAKSIVLDPQQQGKGKWVPVNDKLYKPIAQGIVILKSSSGKNLESAQRFYTFLFGPKARKILKAYGYK
ncbi:molybdate ABC transporter substrate-binding protein [Mucilaginibacter sp. KACC 22063]|uniref:molybdate ABC transporter substrate-binding protein n=1 Tax=Mucilaginibacter sp. KACC 22063 TaxID=3025666 RepID=UPI00236681C6|nr:molybdate ABC transporter substrate-binding protein [Mucilaginibacter sp. KACC 22063]WDF56925.1 molybdate ABC transporter substrate-binding protein [Mucilaginibacter sp. KACC 22063]